MDEEAIFPMGLGPAVALVGAAELGPAEQESAAELGPAEKEPAAELGRVELGPAEQEPAAELGQTELEQGPGPVLENRESPPHPSHRFLLHCPICIVGVIHFPIYM